ncbi:hypothetical protein [Actinoplanes rectilineatus]|uniref:hypothetical protein n=1 Tax=Actinoplanes rectilineatus TaxID=113571 RepID=UPI0005F2E5DF|nr:hypothetical protein [Actinoplanes rectilineatus]
MTHASIREISRHLGLARIPYDRYSGSNESDEAITFRVEDSDASYTLVWSERDRCWVLNSALELSENILGPTSTVKLPVADPGSALLVAAAVEGVHRGLVDEFESVR